MYIIDMSCVSAQDTYKNAIFEEGVKGHTIPKYWAIEPKYKKMIPLNLLRRMSKSVRMGVGASIPLIDQFKESLDGIIIGSANGSIKKSISFLNQIVEYNEGTLTPTDFIQSTSNSIAGTLALMGKITGYNNTHVNNGISFECAVLDALLLFEEEAAERLLLGGVEELSQANYNIDSLRGMFKEVVVDSTQLLTSNTPGSVSGEGAALFVVDAKPSAAAIAQIVDVDQIVHPTPAEVLEKAKLFLKRNNLTTDDIDALFLGYNGDNRMDHYYQELEEGLFPTQAVYVYKNLVGDYYTVSSFAVWLAANLLSGKKMPPEAIKKAPTKPIQRILIYNHYQGTQHGFILINKP
ncbi:MAG: hypothetical protein ACI976_001343 [Aureispira sp.]|jgi:hypothetical protein